MWDITLLMHIHRSDAFVFSIHRQVKDYILQNLVGKTFFFHTECFLLSKYYYQDSICPLKLLTSGGLHVSLARSFFGAVVK